MDASLLEELIVSNKPFKIETASGRVFEVPHRFFENFAPPFPEKELRDGTPKKESKNKY